MAPRIIEYGVQVRDSHPVGSFQARNLPILDIHELAAGKLSALFSRQASRDLFDAHALLSRGDLEREKLRVGFVVYGACSRKDWRTLSPDDIRCDQRELQQQLVPVLRGDAAPVCGEMNDWMERLVSECRVRFSLVLPFEKHERDFLDQVLDRGEIVPELLTGDNELAARIRQHLQLLWKVTHVREHLSTDAMAWRAAG